jgi:hypothetical protein
MRTEQERAEIAAWLDGRPEVTAELRARLFDDLEHIKIDPRLGLIPTANHLLMRLQEQERRAAESEAEARDLEAILREGDEQGIRLTWAEAQKVRSDREAARQDERKAAIARLALPADVSRGGLTRERIIDQILESRVPDGTMPTQPVVAEGLGLADARRIRQVQGPRGWPGLIADARARLDKK